VKAKMTLKEAPDLVRLGRDLKAGMPGATIDDRDGVRLSSGGEWVHVRRSGTEPIVRIIAEAPDAARAEALKEMALRILAAPAA
jgi:phosphomannomutase